MEALMSNWAKPVQSMPEKYIFPPDKRPDTHSFPVINNIPTIDLGNSNNDRARVIEEIFYACKEFGFFEVINHGVPISLMDDTMNVMKEFFAMPPEYKASFYSLDINKKCRIYSSTMNYEHEDFHYWRDNFTHHCYPLQDHIHLWPQKPTTYRETVGKYSIETRKLIMRILGLMCEGLGVVKGFDDNEEICKKQLLSVNHHIPCPDPTLTLGMPTHSDPNLISILHQSSVPGLQIFRHNRWMNVDPTTHSFIVIPGLQLKVISNGEFSSPIHRVVTHSEEARTTIGMFVIPGGETVIEPAPEYAADHPLYRPFTYEEFFNCFTTSSCEADTTLQCFNVNNNANS